MKLKSAILTLSLVLCFCNSVFSKVNNSPPPVNDICSGAIDFGLLECEFYIEFDEDPEATPDPEATGNCINSTEPGQWYTFTTPDPIPYNTIYLDSPWITVEIFSSTSDCSALVFEACGSGPLGFEPEAGTRYYYLATGGFHLTLPFAGLSSCGDPLLSFSACDGPIQTSSYTDCSWSNSMVDCPDDHVIWFSYMTGNSESDLIISAGEYTGGPHGNTANEISISAFSDDCSSLLYGYDVAGYGYVCSAMQNSQTLTLEDLPPGFEVQIAISSGLNDAGHFDLFIENPNEGAVSNDLCTDAETVYDGINSNLSNICATDDVNIVGCPPQSEATVWYEYDPGIIPQDIEITLHSTGINSPAIGIYGECVSDYITSVCGNSIELFCIDYPIFIQIGSSLDDMGTFNLEVESTPSISSIEPVVTGSPICSGSEAGIFISIPSGEIVNILVEISNASSGFITGMQNHSFVNVNSALILDTLVNSSNVDEEAIYTITIESLEEICPTDPIEFSILVHPEFKITELAVEDCAPHMLELDAFDIVEGGTQPFLGILWYWNTSNLIGTTNILSYELIESGEITLKIIDFIGCRQEVMIDVDLDIPIDPLFNFDLRYCRSDQDSIIFPKTSEDGIEGTWIPPGIDLESFSEDGYYDIIFTPNDEYCSNVVFDSVEIYSGKVPDFNLPEILCSEEDIYVFPVEDLNGILGSWDTPSLDLSTFEGTLTNTFSHSNQGCNASFEYEFVVEPKIALTFGQPAMLCRNDEPYTLGNLSEEGYEGNWDVSIIDPSLIVGNVFTTTWTPTSGQSSCLYDTTISILITDPLIPEFNLPTELCSLDGTYTFPLMDDQNLNGTWSVTDINPAEVNGNIQSIFISTDYCTEPFVWEIEIIEPFIPEFNLELELCELEEIYTLPLTADNGIVGTWSQPTIDPSLVAGEQVTLQFQGAPSEFCVEPIELVFEIADAQDPLFELTTQLCWLDEDVILPSISTNGIEGNWTPSLIDVQSNIGGQLSAIFAPSDGSCSNEEVLTFEIESPFVIDPIVTDPSDCAIEDGSILLDVIHGADLEFSIDGGMSWQSSTQFSALGSGGFIILVRSMDLNHCAIEVEAFLSSPDVPTINEVLSNDVSSCTEKNGSIIVEAQGDYLEYSIDDGATWQSSNEFNNLPEGEYLITIREEMSDCLVDVMASIADFPQTEIVMVNSQDISDCDIADGVIEIVASGQALEYSIDDGASWSSESIFNNLPDGTYDIIVQSSEGECAVTSSAEIISPMLPNINNLESQNPLLCSPSIGSIEVEAEGENLEYSIDGGITWQSNNTFQNLLAGDYTVVVRDSEKVNCLDESSIAIELEEEGLPESGLDIISPSECELADGRIEIISSSENVEFSLDGGMTWQTNTIFDNLSSGSYVLITRKILLPDCLVEQTINIPDSECPCGDLTLDFEIINGTCDGVVPAQVKLISIQGMKNPDVDILWQNGETDAVVESISEGWQIVTIAYDDHCEWIDSLWVELVDPIQYEWVIEDSDCPEISNGSIEITNVTGGNGNYQYSLDGVNYQLERSFSDLEEGEYEVFVRDDVDCLTKSTIEVGSHLEIGIDLPEIEVITLGESIVLDPGIDLSKIDAFSWSPKEGILNPNNLVVEVAPEISTTYLLEVIYGECIERKEITIYVEPKEDIYIGNAFSPNGDRNNDVLYIKGISYSSIELKNFSIYDRWGNKVFTVSQPEFNNETDGWDGYFQNDLAVSGVYVYMVNYVQDGESQIKVGTVTLVH